MACECVMVCNSRVSRCNALSSSEISLISWLEVSLRTLEAEEDRTLRSANLVSSWFCRRVLSNTLVLAISDFFFPIRCSIFLDSLVEDEEALTPLPPLPPPPLSESREANLKNQ